MAKRLRYKYVERPIIPCTSTGYTSNCILDGQDPPIRAAVLAVTNTPWQNEKAAKATSSGLCPIRLTTRDTLRNFCLEPIAELRAFLQIPTSDFRSVNLRKSFFEIPDCN